MAQGCVNDVCHGSMFRAEVGMKEAFSPSIVQLLGMAFRPSGSIALHIQAISLDHWISLEILMAAFEGKDCHFLLHWILQMLLNEHILLKNTKWLVFC